MSSETLVSIWSRRPWRLAASLLVCLICLTAAGARAQSRNAGDVLARFIARDATPDSYMVPVHVDVHVHKLITLHFGLNGTQYYQQPDRVALHMRIPESARRLFSQMGTPLTWRDAYDLRLTGVDDAGGRTTTTILGVPKRPGDVDHFVLTVDSDESSPLHARWFCRDGTVIAMSIVEQPEGPYRLPKRAEADLAVSGFRIHAVLDYGTYAVNTAIAQSVFTGARRRSTGRTRRDAGGSRRV